MFENFNVKTAKGLLYEIEESETNPFDKGEPQFIVEVQHLALADPDISKQPWHNDMFGVMTYIKVPSSKGFTYHGYILNSLLEESFTGYVFCSKPGLPLLGGQIGGIMKIAESRFLTNRERGEVLYDDCFSYKGKLLHGMLIDEMFNRWFIETVDGHWKFDLVRLKKMERDLVNGVPYYVHRDEDWADVCGKLFESNIPNGLDWLPRIGTKVKEGLRSSPC